MQTQNELLEQRSDSKRESKTSDSTQREAQAGKDDLVKSDKRLIEHLKTGGHSGITNEFGKPVLLDAVQEKAPGKSEMLALKITGELLKSINVSESLNAVRSNFEMPSRPEYVSESVHIGDYTPQKEAVAGFKSLVEHAKISLENLKAGGHSGITQEFGKPILMGELPQPGADAVAVARGFKGAAAGDNAHKEVPAETHDVQKGETLSKIAREHLGPGATNKEVRQHVADIVRINHIEDANKIFPGQELQLPGRNKDGKLVEKGDAPKNEEPAKGEVCEAPPVDKPPRNEPAESAECKSAATFDEFKTLSRQVFGLIDKDASGILTKDELAAAVQDHRFTGKEAQVVAAMYENFDTIKKVSNDQAIYESGITAKDLAKMTSDSGVMATIDYVSREQDGSRKLFSTDNPTDCIKPEAIHQGSNNDCYFVSALASIAATHPDSIAKMIKDNKDGSYTVTFPGDTENPVTVKGPTEAEMGLYNQTDGHGTWANLMEKAYGEYCRQNISHRSILGPLGGNTQSEGADTGEIIHGRSLKLLTGKSVDTDNLLVNSQETTAEKLKEALHNNRSVQCGRLNIGKSEMGFPGGHAYSVTKFDETGPDGGWVTVRNPWGGENGTTSGTVKISLKQFMTNFSTVSYEEKN